MPAIPPFVLKKLYVKGSLRAESDGFALDLKNTIAPGTITSFSGLDVDGDALPSAQVTLVPIGGDPRPAHGVSPETPLHFSAGATVTLRVIEKMLEPGPHQLVIHVIVQDIGPLDIPISDTLA